MLSVFLNATIHGINGIRRKRIFVRRLEGIYFNWKKELHGTKAVIVGIVYIVIGLFALLILIIF